MLLSFSMPKLSGTSEPSIEELSPPGRVEQLTVRQDKVKHGIK